MNILQFLEQQNIINIIQILLDIGLIVFLMIYFSSRRPREKAPSSAAPELVETLEKIIEETKEIAESFDDNLRERQAVIQKLLMKLDQKLSEAEKVCQRLEKIREAAGDLPHTQFSIPQNPEYQEIIKLSRTGLDARAIAKRLQKPLGEVELILNLQRIIPTR